MAAVTDTSNRFRKAGAIVLAPKTQKTQGLSVLGAITMLSDQKAKIVIALFVFMLFEN
jgi:hypothetical protein